MQRILSITLALFIGLSFSFDAEARRFGGGKSFGAAPKHRQVQPQQRQQQKQAQPQQNNTGKTAATSGASRWLGPLAGIAAGGLLAAMLFGDGFQGLQLFDILIFGLIAFVLFKLFRRRSAPVMQRQPHPASGPAAPVHQQNWPSQSATPPPAAAMQVPHWFDADSFLKGVEEHFYTLQRHWRDGDVDGMA